jgi:hypothetical protein
MRSFPTTGSRPWNERGSQQPEVEDGGQHAITLSHEGALLAYPLVSRDVAVLLEGGGGAVTLPKERSDRAESDPCHDDPRQASAPEDTTAASHPQVGDRGNATHWIHGANASC